MSVLVKPSRRQIAALLVYLFDLHPRFTASAQETVRPQPKQVDPFLVYYGSTSGVTFKNFGLIVLDTTTDAPVLRSDGDQTFLGYLSLVEVHSGRPYFAELSSQGLLLGNNPSWPEAHFIDIRDSRWRARVLDELVPGILARGYAGIFLDTLDSAEFLETRDPVRLAGMLGAAADLVRDIRLKFPSALIMINRGYALLPRVVGQFDMLLGESLRTTFDGRSQSYRRVSPADYDWQRQRMWEARSRDPRLTLFSLDYWDLADREGIARLYAEQRSDGFIPYVATPDLTRIVPPP
jgi:hypothetical protein